MKSNFLLRTITGVIFAIVMIAGIWSHPYTFLALFSIIVYLTLREFYTLISGSAKVQIHAPINGLAGVYLFVASFLYAQGSANETIFLPYLFYIVATFTVELYRNTDTPILNWAYTLLGQIYIALPFSLLNTLIFENCAMANTIFNPLIVLSIFFFVWSNDTGAYLVGSKLGKHRLMEQISPKKSWEGFFGGIAFVVLAAVIFHALFNTYSLELWIGLGVITAIFGVWGDLCESLFKRKIDVKDSGNILPGHGGMLDRFDAVLLAIPAVVIFINLYRLIF